MSQEALYLNDNSSVSLVKLHATPVFAILNNHIRREERQTRVIGTLLGVVNDDQIDITDCFGVPHAEKTDEFVKLNVDYHKTMYSFHRRINRKEEIVGWFTTRIPDEALVNDNSAIIHEFYSNECVDPIHLVVDTTLAGDNMGIRAFTSQPIVIGDNVLGNMFREIKVELVLSEGEVTCLHQMMAGNVNKNFVSDSIFTPKTTEMLSVVGNEKESLRDAVQRLTRVMDEVSAYVEEVCAGKVVGNPEVGYTLINLLNTFAQSNNSLPLQAVYDSKTTDLLMYSYISSLVQTQLQIAEKLLMIL